MAQRVLSYAADADLLATLDDIHRDNFALFVDESELIGIVTRAATDYLELPRFPVLDTNIRSPIAACQSRYIGASRFAITLKAPGHVFGVTALATRLVLNPSACISGVK